MKLPDILYFNPTCEYAVANGNKFWQPNSVLQKMEKDLCTLPFLLARPDDIVLTKKAIPDLFIETLTSSGFNLPKFVPLSEIQSNKNLHNQPLNRLMPWGWSPATHQLLSQLKPFCSKNFMTSAVANWKPEYKSMYSKEFSLTVLKSTLKKLDGDSFLPQELVPEVCTTKKEIDALLHKWGKLMVKAPWSSSGRGLQPVTKKPVHPKVWEKLMGIVNEQGFVIAEPFLDKVLDMAFQFEIKNGEISFIGTSFFETDKKGQYKKNYLNGLPENVDKNLTTFAKKVEELTVPVLQEEIGDSMIGKFYEGYFGVDTLIYRDSANDLKINPCLEINLRQNMGLLSLKIEELLVQKGKGVFSLYFEHGKSFKLFADKMQKKHPLIFSGSKIESGFLALTPATGDTSFGAFLLV